MGFYKPKGASEDFKPLDSRRDVRTIGTKINDTLLSEEGGTYILGGICAAAALTSQLPFGGELVLIGSYFLTKIYSHPLKRHYNFPWRVPKHAKLYDASKNYELLNELNSGNALKYNPSSLYGEGVTYFGVDRITGYQVYTTNSDDRTHLTCIGTTGSGKTEFLLGLVANQLVQNSGLIYLDAKGDPALQNDVSRLARLFGREDDVLTINFITSGVDVSKPQKYKLTNTFNIMSNTSAGMLVELLNSLLDESGGGGDMWKSRAVAFIGALTQTLVYLRDIGYLQLSPATYIEYMELSSLEELVFEHEGKYGESFEKVSLGLKSYITSVPGYNDSPRARKKQDQTTLQQHGYITMQLTRAIGDLTFNYGYIFGVKQGDIDIFDCVLNRRILTIPLPALERSTDSLKMLGKLCIGSIKQMMAGALGNRIEGSIREILESRATNAPSAYRLIFDEFGYVVVPGVSVMPAQGRSLSFAICFAAQDFSDIKRGDANEAEAIWANSNIKVIGKINSGDGGETMNKVNGMTGEIEQARSTSVRQKVGTFMSQYIPSQDLHYQKEKVLPYNDLHSQQEGEFTFLFSKKEDGGRTASGKVVRVSTFYVKSQGLKYLRMNDLCPNLSIEKERIVNPGKRIEIIKKRIMSNHQIGQGASDACSILSYFSKIREGEAYEGNEVNKIKSFLISDFMKSVNVIALKQPKNPPLISIPNNSYVDDDQTHSDENTSIAIGEIVNNQPEFKSTIHIESKPLPKESNVIVPVGIESEEEMSILDLLCLFQYSKGHETRLREYNIHTDEAYSSYNLLPYVPSQQVMSNIDNHLIDTGINDSESKRGSLQKTAAVGNLQMGFFSKLKDNGFNTTVLSKAEPKLQTIKEIENQTNQQDKRDHVLNILELVDRIKKQFYI